MKCLSFILCRLVSRSLPAHATQTRLFETDLATSSNKSVRVRLTSFCTTTVTGESVEGRDFCKDQQNSSER